MRVQEGRSIPEYAPKTLRIPKLTIFMSIQTTQDNVLALMSSMISKLRIGLVIFVNINCSNAFYRAGMLKQNHLEQIRCLHQTIRYIEQRES